MNSADNVNNGSHLSNSEIANQVISKYTGSSATAKRKSNPISKDDEEYSRKRQRNNVAVKKSREKAKNRIQETQVRVEQLSKENEDLQTKVTLLSKELNVLRALFTNGGFTLPCDLQLMNSASNPSDHSVVGSSQYSTIASEDSIRHHMPSLPPGVDTHEKSAFHTPEDSKIPPLRPMPRVPRDIPSSHKSHAISSSSMSQLSPRGYPSDRASPPYKYPIKAEVTSPTCTAPPLLIQPPNITSSSHSHYMNSVVPRYKPQEHQHTSVIRSASELNGNSNSMMNTLGKFCVIQDPDNSGQVKIVPISA